MAEADAGKFGGPKRPPSAYLLFLQHNRAAIAKDLGTNLSSAVSKCASERWTALDDKDKEPYQNQAKEMNDKYSADMDLFKKTAGYQQYVEAKKEAKTAKAEKKKAKQADMEAKQPEEGKQPEETKKQPEEAKKQPEEAKKQPEEAKKQPEEAKKQPEEAKKQPEEAKKQPGTEAKQAGKRDREDAANGKKAKRARAEGEPKRPLGAFLLWLHAEGHAQAKAKKPLGSRGEVMQLAGEIWKEVTDKKQWEDKAKEEKQKYDTALKAFKESKSQDGGADDEDGGSAKDGGAAQSD